jgi:3-hydroxymyristoyl/3-hydroxydecanoyl-(acyl carrier protein) dehydratase
LSREAGPFVLTEVRNVRYGNMVRPGEALRVEVALTGQPDGDWEFNGLGSVDGQPAVQGKFRLSRI